MTRALVKQTTTPVKRHRRKGKIVRRHERKLKKKRNFPFPSQLRGKPVTEHVKELATPRLEQLLYYAGGDLKKATRQAYVQLAGVDEKRNEGLYWLNLLIIYVLGEMYEETVNQRGFIQSDHICPHGYAFVKGNYPQCGRIKQDKNSEKIGAIGYVDYHTWKAYLFNDPEKAYEALHPREKKHMLSMAKIDKKYQPRSREKSLKELAVERNESEKGWDNDYITIHAHSIFGHDWEKK